MNDSLRRLSEPECDRAAARLSEPSLTAFDLLKTKTEMKNSPLFFILTILNFFCNKSLFNNLPYSAKTIFGGKYVYCKYHRVYPCASWRRKLGSCWNFRLELGWCNLWRNKSGGLNHCLLHNSHCSTLAHHFPISHNGKTHFHKRKIVSIKKHEVFLVFFVKDKYLIV